MGGGPYGISMPSSPELSPRQTAWQLRIDQQDDETAAAIGVQPIDLPATGKSCRISFGSCPRTSASSPAVTLDDRTLCGRRDFMTIFA